MKFTEVANNYTDDYSLQYRPEYIANKILNCEVRLLTGNESVSIQSLGARNWNIQEMAQ